jgi:hypothetical protein
LDIRAEFGNDADQHPLPRSAAQRSFDARQAIFELAAEAADGGATPGGIQCGGHNRFKHPHKWRTRRDEPGRSYSIRPDGTIVLPVGEREPDRSIDELNRITRARLAAFRPLERVG